MAAQIVIGPRRDGQGRSVGCQSAGEKIQFIADDDGLEKHFTDCAYFFTKNVIVRTFGYTVTLKA